MSDTTNSGFGSQSEGLDDSSTLESLYEKFESAWVQTPFPDLRNYLGENTGESQVTLLAELIQIDLERRWRSDVAVPAADPIPARPKIEDYLTALPEFESLDQIPLEVIVAEFRVRQIWGDQPDLSDFVSRFPQRSSELKQACAKLELDSSVQPTQEFQRDSNSEGDAGAGSSTSNESLTHVENSPEQSFRSLNAGMQVSHYSLTEQIGKGGFGVVFLAQNLDRPYQQCAIKLIRPDRVTAPKLTARFKQEIAALTGLSHPNIACASDSGEWQGVLFLVMEYINGKSLKKFTSRHRQTPVADACELVRQAAVGLQHIHEMNRTHRDLKPSNLMLTADGIVKILDLGMARLTDIEDQEERLTSLGDVMGTPDYMAPEQWQDSSQVDIRGDIYSLGCTLFCLLTGRAPFAVEGKFDPVALMHAHSKVPIPDVSQYRGDVPEAVSALIKDCMAKKTEDRPAEPQTVADRLAEFAVNANLAGLIGDSDSVHEASTELTLIDSGTNPEQMASSSETLIDSGSPPADVTDVMPSQEGSAIDTATMIEGVSGIPTDIGQSDASRNETLIEDTDDPDATKLPTFEQTLADHGSELQTKFPGESLKPAPTTRDPGTSNQQGTLPTGGSSGSTTMRSYSSNGSVVLKPREVTYGKVTGAMDAEYEIGAKLGEGGMGAVYQARQGSVDRGVALKMVKKDHGPSNAQDMFLAEAIVTGTLEHPNIVPIYDLGVNATGELFYAMKEVRGDSWKGYIDKLDLDENLDVLVKVTDAIAYSHEKGIVHRDLKPDNIMIGEFGEVVVMDWGLALPTEDFEKPGLAVTRGLAGTPSYMAPEMADLSLGPIGPHSDIYLLGGQLFRFVTGHAPHVGKTALAALRAAAVNTIEWPKDDDSVDSELLEIARKAMATKPEDRYLTALDFKKALRDYRSHSESRRLTDSARKELTSGEASGNYRSFERAAAALEEAINLWSGNDRAIELLKTARLRYAQAAFQKGDLDLAESQLSPDEPAHEELLKSIRDTRAEREAQALRLRRMKQTAAGLAAVVFLTVSVSAVMINSARNKEKAAKQQEAIAKTEAVQRFRESQSTIAELSGLADALSDYPLAQAERQKLLEAVSRYYDQQTNEQSDVPEIRIEQLSSLMRLGEVFNQLAQYEKAVDTWDRAIALASDPPVVRDFGEKATVLHAMALAGRAESMAAQGDLDGARDTGTQAIEMLSSIANQTDDSTLHTDVARMQLQQALIEKTAGQYSVALSLVRTAVESLDGMSETESVEPVLKELAVAHSVLAQIQELNGDYVAAADAASSAITVWKQLTATHPENVQYADGLATSQIDIANVRRAAGNDPLDDYTNAVETFQRLVEFRPGVPRYRFNLASALSGLAWTRNRLVDTENASQLAVEATSTFVFLNQRYPEDARFPLGEVSVRILLAEILRDRGEFDLAIGITVEASELLNPESISPDLPQSRERFGELSLIYGQVLSAIDDPAAQDSLRRSADALLELADDESGLPRHRDTAAWAMYYLSHELVKSQEMAGAEEAVKSAIEIRSQLPERARWLDSFAWLLLQSPVESLRDAARAEALAESAVKLSDRSPRFLRTLALAQLRTGNVDGASESLSRAQSFMNSEHPEQQFLLAMVAFRQNDADQANQLFETASELMNSSAPANPRLLTIQHEAAEVTGAVVPVRKDMPETPAVPAN